MSLFLPTLKQQGYLNKIHPVVCIVGSRKLKTQAKDDYGYLGWGIFAPNLTIHGFDADADACDAANATLEAQQIPWTENHIPLALDRSVGEKTLYVTKAVMCSSLYPPNEALLERIDRAMDLMSLDFTVEIETTTLDEVCFQENIETIDFLQVDVQGADLDVLKGGEQILKEVVAVEVEVLFSPLYKDQPLFADIDAYLREQGFVLFDLQELNWGMRKKFPAGLVKRPQFLWANALYFRDPIASDGKLISDSVEKQFKLAAIADLYNCSDYCMEILEHLTLNYGDDPGYNFADAILESLLPFFQDKEAEFATLEIVNSLFPYLRRDDLKALVQNPTFG